MACNSVAVLNAQLQTSLADFIAYDGALDTLKKLLAQRGYADAEVRVENGRLHVLGAVVDARGNVSGPRYAPLDAIRTAIEQISGVIMVELTKERIEALAKVEKVQRLEGGGMILTVDL